MLRLIPKFEHFQRRGPPRPRPLPPRPPRRGPPLPLPRIGPTEKSKLPSISFELGTIDNNNNNIIM